MKRKRKQRKFSDSEEEVKKELVSKEEIEDKVGSDEVFCNQMIGGHARLKKVYEEDVNMIGHLKVGGQDDTTSIRPT